MSNIEIHPSLFDIQNSLFDIKPAVNLLRARKRINYLHQHQGFFY